MRGHAPRGVKADEGHPADTLYEGLPPWLRRSVLEWMHERFLIRLSPRNVGVRHELLLEVERHLRRALTWNRDDEDTLIGLLNELANDPESLFRVIDLLLSKIRDPSGRLIPRAYEEVGAEVVGELDGYLREGGSAWTVVVDDWTARLERRVDPTAVANAQQVISTPGRASDHLALAWAAAYGRAPDPAAAYREAVKAVEAAAQPVVTPKNDRATLGTLIADIRKAPAKWLVDLYARPEFNEDAQVEAVATMMELLWKGDLRHGTPNPAVPVSVSQEHAETAVQLAVLLVQIFIGGRVHLR